MACPPLYRLEPSSSLARFPALLPPGYNRGMDERRKKLGTRFWLPLALLVAYPLSGGPVYSLLFHFNLPPWAAEYAAAFYSPLGRATRKVPILKGGFEAYGSLWVDTTKEPATRLRGQPGPYSRLVRHAVELTGLVTPAWLIWCLVRWINRRDENRHVNPPAPNPDARLNQTEPLPTIQRSA
jgi:hypothetical protein